MRKLALVALFPLCVGATDLEYKGNISLEAKYLDHDIKNKRDNSIALRGEFELKKEFGDGQFVISSKAIYDKDDSNRRYADLSDFYYKHNFEDSDLLVGKSTRFWGALEFYNITDVFNSKDFLDDPFDYDSKLGAWNAAYTKYLDNGELSLIVKVHEQKQKMQEMDSVNYFFPTFYDDDFQTSDDENRPTIYLKYSGSGEEIQMDYAFVYQNGYDSQRYMSMSGNALIQNAYIVNKLLAYTTYVHESTIYKGEIAYALSDDDKVSDYGEFGLGVEHTLYSFWDKKDLGLLAEYYRYEAKDSEKYGAKEFAKIFSNDLTLGFRLSINDTSSSEVLGGVDLDLDSDEKIYFVEYETRLFDKYKLKTSYQHLEADDESMFKDLDQLKLEFGYYF
jgi:hypothetical protein